MNFASTQGWTTPYKAIYGGAKWVAENREDQNTIYEMTFHSVSPGKHQYATDTYKAGLVNDVTNKIYQMPGAPSTAQLIYQYPVYRDFK